MGPVFAFMRSALPASCAVVQICNLEEGGMISNLEPIKSPCGGRPKWQSALSSCVQRTTFI